MNIGKWFLALLTVLSAITDKVVFVFMPQFYANHHWPSSRKIQQVTMKKGLLWRRRTVQKSLVVWKWRWVRYPLPAEANEWICQQFFEIWLRWLILWLFLSWGCVHIPQLSATLIVITFVYLWGWTMAGLVMAKKRQKQAK